MRFTVKFLDSKLIGIKKISRLTILQYLTILDGGTVILLQFA